MLRGVSISITASIEDEYNNSSDASAVAVARDVVKPSVTLTTTDLHINNANKASYSLAGACETGLPVSVSIGTLTAQSITCDTTDNTWAITSFDTTSLGEGVDYDLLITQTDAVGNVGRVEAQFDKDITAPTIAVTSSRNVNRAGQSDVDLAGSCSEQGKKVGITVGTAPKVEVDCTATGWVYENLDLSDIANYPEGIIALTLIHRDQTGNETSISNVTTQLSKDITPPTLSVTSQPLPTINTGNAGGYTFQGDCADSGGNQVIITISGFSTTFNATCEEDVGGALGKSLAPC